MKNLRQLLLVSYVTMSITNLHGAEEKSHYSQSPDSYSGSIHSLSPLINSESPQKNTKRVLERSEEEKTALIEKLKSSNKFRAAVTNKAEEKRNKISITTSAQAESNNEYKRCFYSSDDLTLQDTYEPSNTNMQSQSSTVSDQEDRPDVITIETPSSQEYDLLFAEQIKTINPNSSQKDCEEFKIIVSRSSMSECNKIIFINQIDIMLSMFESEKNEETVTSSINSVVYSSTQRWMDHDALLSDSDSNSKDNDSTTATVGTSSNLHAKTLVPNWTDTTKKTSPKKPKAPQLSEDKNFGISDENDAANTERWNQRIELWNAWLKIQQQDFARYLSAWISK